MLKKPKILISSQPIDRFWRNLLQYASGPSRHRQPIKFCKFDNSRSWCILTLWTPLANIFSQFQKSKIMVAAILKILKNAIFPQRKDRVWRHLARCTLAANKILRFHKSKMVASAIWIIKKLQCLFYGWSSFEKIWHGDVPRSSRSQHTIILLKIQHGSQLPSGNHDICKIIWTFSAEILVCGCIFVLPSLSAIKCTVIDNKTANVNDKNCNLSIVLTAIDQKLQKKS